MKFLPALLLLCFATGAFAELPQKRLLNVYSGLWLNSPFTSKPPPPAAGPEVNLLDDYTLGGVSPVSGGYRITLFNKKNPEERIILPERTDFKILAVAYKTGDPLGTTVRLSTGGKEGTVAFDPQFLTLKSAPAPQPQAIPQNPNMPTGVPTNPNIPANPGEAIRQPRPRVVTQPNGAAPGTNPGLPPGVNPNPQQRINPPNTQRPAINTNQPQRPNRR